MSPSTLAVPLILHGPGVPVAQRVDVPVRQMDVGRTLLTLAGVDPGNLPGEDLLNAASHEGPRFSIAANTRSAAVQDGQWLLRIALIEHGLGMQRLSQHSVQLFDLEADRACVQDVSGQHAEVTVRLREMLLRWLSDASDMSLAEESQQLGPEALEQLAALGYAAGAGAPTGKDWYDADCECEHCLSFR